MQTLWSNPAPNVSQEIGEAYSLLSWLWLYQWRFLGPLQIHNPLIFRRCLHLICLLLVSLLLDTFRTCVQSCRWQPLLRDFQCSLYCTPTLRGNWLGFLALVVALLRWSGVGSCAGTICVRSGSRFLGLSGTGLRLCQCAVSLCYTFGCSTL